MRLIDADDLWKCKTCFHMQNGQCDGYCDHGELYRPAYSKLKIVDAAPVVHGHWIPHDELICHEDECSVCREYVHICSIQCGCAGKEQYNYCPNCGARMDEVIE